MGNSENIQPKQARTSSKSSASVYDKLFTDATATRAMQSCLTDSERGIIEETYLNLFHVPMARTCSNCLSDAFFEMFNVWKDKKRFFAQLNCEYRLRAGVLLQVFSRSEYDCTNKNLTNALAERHLKEFPEKSKLFSLLPPDWEQRILK